MKRYYFLLILLFGCGDETAYRNRPIVQERAEVSFRDFETRLTNSLLVSGTQCFGGEIADADGQTYTCAAGNWLVTVDNVNTCTPDGCTEVSVQPIIATLLAPTGDSVSTYYEISPVIPVSDEVDNVLESVRLRTRENEEPVVIFFQ